MVFAKIQTLNRQEAKDCEDDRTGKLSSLSFKSTFLDKLFSIVPFNCLKVKKYPVHSPPLNPDCIPNLRGGCHDDRMSLPCLFICPVIQPPPSPGLHATGIFHDILPPQKEPLLAVTHTHTQVLYKQHTP